MHDSSYPVIHSIEVGTVDRQGGTKFEVKAKGKHLTFDVLLYNCDPAMTFMLTSVLKVCQYGQVLSRLCLQYINVV